METTVLLKSADDRLAEMISTLVLFSDEQINLTPLYGGWTAGQVAQHVIMAGSGFVELMNGPVKVTDRAPDGMVQKIKDIFLDFSVKLKSPEFVIPPATNYELPVLLSNLKSLKEDLLKVIGNLPLTETCLAFELPAMGHLTRLEAAQFVIYHTQRHVRQLKNIYLALNQLSTFSNTKP